MESEDSLPQVAFVLGGGGVFGGARVAASIERAAEHWFDSGLLADVLLASSAVLGSDSPATRSSRRVMRLRAGSR